ncbi:MAG: aminotransferase class V-fold PLP-dependent enzyme [Cytophagales bacterium]|nr:aminotransferase class V-fold PLP-dependent enzyme [Cytophagales bacterium]
MAPLSKKVENAGNKGIKRKRKPYQITPEDFFHDSETLRQLFAKLIDCDEPNRIVTAPSVSYAMANVVKNLAGKEGEIILTDKQFPSNVYPWLSAQSDKIKVKFIPKPEGVEKGARWNQQVLDAINENTLLVGIGNVHWADGTLFDLKAIRKKTSENDAFLVIDGTQSVGALPFSVKEIQPDMLVCAAYKWLFGPYSMTLAYFGGAFDQGSPIEENWINREGAQNFGGLIHYKENYEPGALRYEVGEHSNFILVPMMIEALKQVLNWDPANIQAYCKFLMDPLVEAATDMGFGFENEIARSHHLVGMTLPEGLAMETLQQVLHQNKVSVSVRGTSVRVAPNVYNDQRDINRLIKSLSEAIAKSK